MNNASGDIAQYLQQITTVTSLPATYSIGLNLFVGREPSSPANCVTIIDRPSWPLGLNLDGLSKFEYASIQVRVRNTSYNNAVTMSQEIISLLHGKNNFIINNTEYFVCACVSGPYLLEWDENNRVIFTIDFDIQRRRS